MKNDNTSEAQTGGCSDLSTEINVELGRLFDHPGEREKTLDCYQRAMGVLEYKLAQLPQPNAK